MIPFNRAHRSDSEATYVAEALAKGPLSGDGPFGRKAEKRLSELLGGGRVLLTTSCTHALEMSALLLDVGPGDEVILPSFTFVSTANAFALRGAKPVFVDVREDTLNLDERLVEKAITSRTRAIVPVHYAGVGCAMDELVAIASARKVPIVEDNAHGLFGAYQGKPLGSFGQLATQSFHETKNVSCGEGGALVVNDPALVERAEILREKGTNRSRFFRGQVDKYTWVDVGSSWVVSDVLAAILVAQLEEGDRIQAARQRVWDRYAEGLAGWAARASARLPIVPEDRTQAYHLFYVLMPDLARRTALLQHLERAGVKGVFHYVPLHSAPMGERFGGRAGDLPVTESVSERLVRLPLFSGLSDEDVARVLEAVTSFG